jgi:hypothetical protein
MLRQQKGSTHARLCSCPLLCRSATVCRLRAGAIEFALMRAHPHSSCCCVLVLVALNGNADIGVRPYSPASFGCAYTSWLSTGSHRLAIVDGDGLRTSRSGSWRSGVPGKSLASRPQRVWAGGPLVRDAVDLFTAHWLSKAETVLCRAPACCRADAASGAQSRLRGSRRLRLGRLICRCHARVHGQRCGTGRHRKRQPYHGGVVIIRQQIGGQAESDWQGSLAKLMLSRLDSGAATALFLRACFFKRFLAVGWPSSSSFSSASDASAGFSVRVEPIADAEFNFDWLERRSDQDSCPPNIADPVPEPWRA